jgi:hypothetical protein
MIALVAEADSLQANVPSSGMLELLRVARLAQPRLGLQHLGDPGARGQRLLQRRDALAEHAQRPDEHHHVGVEGHERAGAQISRHHLPARALRRSREAGASRETG